MTLRHDEPLIGVVVDEDGEDVTRYFTEDEPPDGTASNRVAAEALAAIGAWSDHDWDEMEAALDRIRHETSPTPPIES